MEIALSPALPTYSGGLGMLAGDTLRSAADTAAPMIAVSLVYRRGYFRQHLDSVGQQTESDLPWSPETTLPSAHQVVIIAMQGREVSVCAWRFDVVGVAGHVIPVFLLDTDLEGNDLYDRRLTDHLYGGDTYYRLCQETVLGLGGVALLQALGVKPEVYHMNEGHAALLGIGLLEERLGGAMLTLGFARRVATYKRSSLLFHNPDRLAKIAKKIGGLQIFFAGKAHPADAAGKGLIRDVFASAASLKASDIRILYLENYDWELARLLTQGVDVWLNTPRRQYEASGTSGMKAALNGVPSRARRMVDRGMRGRRDRMGDRRRRQRGRRGGEPLPQAGEQDRAALRPAERLGADAAALQML